MGDVFEFDLAEAQATQEEFRYFHHLFQGYCIELHALARQCRASSEGSFTNALRDSLQKAYARAKATSNYCYEFAAVLAENIENTYRTDLDNAARQHANDPTVAPRRMADLLRKINTDDADQLHPVSIYQIGPDEYVIAIKGTDLNPPGSNDPDSALTEYSNYDPDSPHSGGKSRYRADVERIIRNELPLGSKLNLVGHSLGGMVVDQLAQDPAFLTQYQVATVTTFGSPTTLRNPHPDSLSPGNALPPVKYQQFSTLDDPVTHSAFTTDYLSKTQNAIGVMTQRSGTNGDIPGQQMVDGSGHGGYWNSTNLRTIRLPFAVKAWEHLGSFSTVNDPS
jgi:hypothetical protein